MRITEQLENHWVDIVGSCIQHNEKLFLDASVTHHVVNVMVCSLSSFSFCCTVVSRLWQQSNYVSIGTSLSKMTQNLACTAPTTTGNVLLLTLYCLLCHLGLVVAMPVYVWNMFIVSSTDEAQVKQDSMSADNWSCAGTGGMPLMKWQQAELFESYIAILISFPRWQPILHTMASLFSAGPKTPHLMAIRRNLDHIISQHSKHVVGKYAEHPSLKKFYESVSLRCQPLQLRRSVRAAQFLAGGVCQFSPIK